MRHDFQGEATVFTEGKKKEKRFRKTQLGKQTGFQATSWTWRSVCMPESLPAFSIFITWSIKRLRPPTKLAPVIYQKSALNSWELAVYTDA